MSERLKASLILTLSLVVTACKDVKQVAPAQQIVIATFQSPNIPTPNDLALQAVPTLPAGVQTELLQAFVNQGGFPSDQEVPVNVPISAIAFNSANNRYEPAAAPTVDVTTITPQTAAVLKIDGGQIVPVETEASAKPGLITFRKKADASGARRWAPGRYVFAMRGGPSGVKTTDGSVINPDSAIALTLPNKDLSIPANQPVGGLNGPDLNGNGIPDIVEQLEGVRAALWKPVDWAPNASSAWAPCNPGISGCLTGTISSAYAAVDAAFPHMEVASIAAFKIAPAAPLTDPSTGQIPLPSSLLLDPARPVPGTNGARLYVRNVPAFGPAAAGLATLDGFSTTGMILAPLSGPVDASTINKGTVFLFELPDGSGTPRALRDVAGALGAAAPSTAEILIQPPDLNQAVTVGGTTKQATTAIGLQPGVGVPIPSPATVVMVPPLKEKKNYAVVITDGVKDLAGNALRRSVMANLLFSVTSPLVDGSGKSQIAGVSDADAAGLTAMRAGLTPLITNIGPLTGTSLTKDNVVMAYTVQTQTVTDTSVLLSALPYDPNGDGNPADSVAFTTLSADPFDPATVGILAPAQAALFPNVDSFLSANVVTIDAINPATGALNPNPAAWAPTAIPALVAVPKVPATCLPTAPCPVPLVVWHHGLNGGHLQMLTVADSLAQRGFVVAAIDAPYHGDRAFCEKNSDCTTDGTADGVCTPDTTKAGQGDAVPPGTCTIGHLRGANLATAASGNYFISANFFRIRDGFRQDLIDQSALALALARPPAAAGFPQPAANAVAAALLAKGIVVNPTAVYYEGQSLGGMTGAPILATNPRFARGVLDVPGGTLVDVFTNAPAFANDVNALFLGLGIDRSKIATDPSVAAKYVQTLILAKWILDPADPVNYAANVKAKLASPLAALGPFAHSSTDVLGQLAKCDQVVPNATTVVNGRPLPYGDLLLSLGGVQSTLFTSASATNNCVPHGVLADTLLPGSIGGPVRDQAADFLQNLTAPLATIQLQ